MRLNRYRGAVLPSRRLGTALVVGCLWLGVSPALAQEDFDTPPEAIEFYREAREHYAGGRYDEAAEALERALVLDPDSPTLVYNLARVYELLGDLERSLRYYERYRELLPQQQAQEADRAEATIRRLQGARATGQGRQDDEPAPREVAPLRQLPGVVLVRENGVADEAFWIALGGGAVSLAAGAVFGSLALVSRADADDFVLGRGGGRQDRDRLYDNATTFGVVSDVTLGLGGAAVIAAILLYFLREHTVERAPVRASEGDGATVEPSASLTPDGVALGLRGTF